MPKGRSMGVTAVSAGCARTLAVLHTEAHGSKAQEKAEIPYILGELVGDMGTEPCLYFPKE